jgi:hypothetical protein
VLAALGPTAGLRPVAASADRDAAPVYGENRYWPGDFEESLVGGMFSSHLRCTLSDQANRTPRGAHAWALEPGYQHLELLMPGHRRALCTFWARSPHEQRFELHVITPDHDPADASVVSRKVTYPVTLVASDEWVAYEIAFETIEPFPPGSLTEVLLAAYNGQQEPVYLDDLALRWEGEDPAAAAIWREVDVLDDADFEEGGSWSIDPAQLTDAARAARPDGSGHALLIAPPGHAAGPSLTAWQPIDAEPLRGRRIRLTAEVAFPEYFRPRSAWAAVLLVLRQGVGPEARPLPTAHGWPFWMTLGQAAEPGTFGSVSAEFDVPADAEELTLSIQAQEELERHRAYVDRIRVHVQDP